MTFAMVGSVRAPGILDGRSAVVPSAGFSNSSDTDFLRIFARHRSTLCTRPYIHHVHGRVRIRAEALKRNLVTLDAIRAEFEAIGGVRSAVANPLTGSIVIDYDPSVLDPQTVSTAFAAPRSGIDGRDLPAWAEQIGPKVIEWMLEKLAVALIAAVV